jgi:hypothetical protein
MKKAISKLKEFIKELFYLYHKRKVIKHLDSLETACNCKHVEIKGKKTHENT